MVKNIFLPVRWVTNYGVDDAQSLLFIIPEKVARVIPYINSSIKNSCVIEMDGGDDFVVIGSMKEITELITSKIEENRS